MKKTPTRFSIFGRDVLECTARVDAAYAEYRAVVDGPHSAYDRMDAWDMAVEKRDAAYARFADAATKDATEE